MIVKENINFERGQDPKDAMDIGMVDKRILEKKVEKFLHDTGLLNDENTTYNECLLASNKIVNSIIEEYDIDLEDDNMTEEMVEEIRAKIEKIFKHALEYYLK